MDDLPSEFDVVVIGTGLAESIVSAAAARVGHSVLHLDPRDYYGGKWTTINFEALEVGSFASDPQNASQQSDLQWKNAIGDFEPVWYVQSEDLKRSLREVSRKFNVDVYSKVLLAREEIIQLLIDSNVSRYLEFKCIQKLYASLPQESIVEPIPLSRSDIFTTKSLGLVEKRKLTKFIELVLKENEENAEVQLRSFDQLVEQSKVNDKIQHLLRQAVKTVEDELDPEKLNLDFVERCKTFLRSIGRYGNQTPYLWTLYGVGEICQAFCRLSAIYGGIFILKRSVAEVKVESDGVKVTTDGKEITAKHLILGPELIYKSEQQQPEKISSTKRIFRGILVVQGGSLRGQVEASEENQDQSEMAVYKIGPFEVIQLDYSSLAVPKPFCLIQVTGPSEESSSPRAAIETALSGYLDFSGKLPEGQQEVEPPESDGQDAEKLEEKAEPPVSEPELVESKPDLGSKPLVLFASYFSVASRVAMDTSERIWDCATNSTEITAEILRAREIFSKMYPDDDFLPKAADGTDTEEPIDEIVKEFQAQTLNANLENSDETVPETAQDETETAAPSESA